MASPPQVHGSSFIWQQRRLIKAAPVIFYSRPGAGWNVQYGQALPLEFSTLPSTARFSVCEMWEKTWAHVWGIFNAPTVGQPRRSLKAKLGWHPPPHCQRQYAREQWATELFSEASCGSCLLVITLHLGLHCSSMAGFIITGDEGDEIFSNVCLSR